MIEIAERCDAGVVGLRGEWGPHHRPDALEAAPSQHEGYGGCAPPGEGAGVGGAAPFREIILLSGDTP